MNKYLLMGFVGLSLGCSAVAQAQTCTRLPTCEELGFTKSEAQCNGKSMVRCPLNKGKVYCEEGKLLTSCPAGYADVDLIEPYCKGENMKLVFSDSSLECAKCENCGKIGHFSEVAGCCAGTGYDGCSYENGNVKDANGCWTCSKCRNQYTLNSDGLCVDPSIISGGACSSGYAKYEDIFPYCTGSSETTKIVEHSTLKGCYTCKKCSTGYYFNNKCSGIGDSSDGNGCKRCTSCSITSVDDSPVDGWCR